MMYDPLRDVHNTTLFGVKIFQYWADLWVWERFLNLYRIASFVELGTGSGAMSTFLAMQCQWRGMEFWTLDIVRPWDPHFSGEHFILADIFSEQGKDTVCTLLATVAPPVLLYCDNGNKPKEMRTFVPYLRSRDYVAVHDWGTEIGPLSLFPRGRLRKVFWKQCEKLSSITRFWRIR